MPEIPADPGPGGHPPHDRDELHEIYRGWRAVADRTRATRVLVGEVWLPGRRAVRPLPPPGRAPHGLQLRLHGAALGCRSLRAPSTRRSPPMPRSAPPRRGSSRTTTSPGRSPATAGRTRPSPSPASGSGPPTRYSTSGDGGPGQRRCSPRPCPARCTSTRATSSGLDEVEVPVDEIQDPMHARSGGIDPGRDGCRVPLPWAGDGAALRLQPGGATGRAVAVASQPTGPRLTVERAGDRIRRRCSACTGTRCGSGARSLASG